MTQFFGLFLTFLQSHITQECQPKFNFSKNNRWIEEQSEQIQYNMQASFLRVDDWAPTHHHANNQSWTELLRIIEQFQHLTDAQKKQIIDCVKELTTRRIQAVKNFYKYKTSLKVHGQFKKEPLNIYEGDKARYFFQDNYGAVQQIILAISKNPKTLANMLSEQSAKKLEQTDFAQNILYCLYPCYLPAILEDNTFNRSLAFIQSIISHWNYNIKAGRPQSYSVIDQIINGFNKAPEVVCYVEKVSITFMQNINKCKMDFFAFDEEAIMHEMEIKRSMAMSQNPIPTKSKWNKLKSFFKNSKEDEFAESFYSQASDISDRSELEITAADIMKSRQKDFITVVKKTIQKILELQTPYILNVMFRFFHQKIQRQVLKQTPIKQRQPTSEQNKPNRGQSYRHYCYFLLTNLVFEELHNKFTIEHEDSGMTPADLQNITQIIRIMTHIFQGHLPEGEKYKNEKVFGELQTLIPRIPEFYDNILSKSSHIARFIQKKQQMQRQEGVFSNQTSLKQILKKQQQDSIKLILTKMHQNTIVLSFDDIRRILHFVKSSKLFAEQLNLSQKCVKMAFLQEKKIYSNVTKTVTFDNIKHEVDKILFVFNSSNLSLNQVAKYYSGDENPLKNMPVLTKALMYGSNLTVSQALEVTKSLQLIQNLPIKQMKYYLGKLSQRYCNLYLKDSEIISQKFRTTIEQHLTRNIERKANLLLHRDDIVSRIDHLQKVINFYTEQLQSSQFYERISHVFIQNIKIKIYMRIESDELQVYKTVNEMKGVHLQSILMTDTDSKGKKLSDQYLLRNSFKNFSNIRDFLRCLTKNNITRSAINCGRRVEEFNETFSKACNIIVSYIEDFMSKRQLLKNLNKDRLAKTIISNIQSHIYEKCRGQGALDEDQALSDSKKKINKYVFYQKDLASLEVDWDFLIDEGVKKFKIMQTQTSISQRLRHFEQLFKMVFTIVGFTMPKNKISAEIINPIMQYLILISENTRHHDCLFSLQCLKWNASPQTHYNIILYQSSLLYVSQMMAKDYPL